MNTAKPLGESSGIELGDLQDQLERDYRRLMEEKCRILKS
jgi:hypothetical protein